MGWFRKRKPFDVQPSQEFLDELGADEVIPVSGPAEALDMLPPSRRRPKIELDADKAQDLFDQLGADDAGTRQTPSSAGLRGRVSDQVERFG